jgi:hypothetical protein
VARLAIMLAVLASGLLVAPQAQAARSEFYGITQAHTYDPQDLFGIAFAAKVHTNRAPIVWDKVQPTRTSFDWASVDQLVGAYAAAGVRTAPFLWGSPAWAGTGGLKRPPTSASSMTAWKTFLKAAVARYKPGGTYWGTPYHQEYGANATPLPIQSWQIWNEVNLQFSYPGSTYQQKAQKYGALVQASHEAIKSKDPQAQTVLAGITTQKDPNAFKFLGSFYNVRHIKDSFDVAAQHPYGSSDNQIKTAIQKFRAVMGSHADKGTPLWITEFAWGSGPPDSIGVNKGLMGQATALTNSYKMLLNNRTAWNLQRVYWYLWRDPVSGTGGCSFCETAGLLRNNRDPKPALDSFLAFTAETTRPQATITGGPSGLTHDKTPTFSFRSNEAGSTFQCRFDAKPFAACASPYTAKTLTNGQHKFYVKAIDAAGNESTIKSRSFRVG